MASYRSFVGPNGPQLDDVAWTYADPLTDGLPVAGHWSFMGEGIETEVDGTLLPSDS